MSITREYNLDNGVEADELPDAGTPTDGSDLITKGYADTHYQQVSGEATAAIANNQTNANVTGLIASDLYRVTRVRYWVRRVATATVMETGELVIMFDGTNFHLARGPFAETPTTAGMSFDVNASTGQVTYTSSNIAGSYDTVNSKMGFVRTTQGTI